MTEVAYEVGFSDLAAFNKAFEQHHGVQLFYECFDLFGLFVGLRFHVIIPVVLGIAFPG